MEDHVSSEFLSNPLGTRTPLLWIDCANDNTRMHSTKAAIKKHVMLNHKAKRDAQMSQTGRKVRDTASDITSQHLERPPNGNNKYQQVSGHRRITGQPRPNQDKVPLDYVYIKPTPALTIDNENKLYRAAWWHHFRPTQDPNIDAQKNQIDWKSKAKVDWAAGFWQASRGDPTLCELFLCYAAAKEASVRKQQESRAYYVHKGRALSYVSRDLQNEGHMLRPEALVAICFMSWIAFAEKDYVTAELHFSTLARLLKNTTIKLPPTLWLCFIGCDLRLTGITSKAPMLPYYLPSDFPTLLPSDIRARAKALALDNCRDSPIGSVFDAHEAFRTFQLLHELENVNAAAGELSWTFPLSVYYQMLHHTATLHDRVDREADTMEEALVLTAVSMQIWYINRDFLSQSGIQTHLLHRFVRLVKARKDIDVLCTKWVGKSGSLNLLLATMLVAVYCTSSEQIYRANGDLVVFQCLLDKTRDLAAVMGLELDQVVAHCLRSCSFVLRFDTTKWDTVVSLLKAETTGNDYGIESVNSVFRDLRLPFD